MKRATPDLLENLLLCDPVTERGREKLDSLGLLEIISPEVFFQQTGGFCVPQAELIAYPDDEDNPEYDTTPTAQRIRLIRERRDEFNTRFHVTSRRSKMRHEFTVLMGVCGAGKSLELQRQLYTNDKALPYHYSNRTDLGSESAMSPRSVYFDMECVNALIPIGRKYRCECKDDPLELVFTKVLATFINYIAFLYEQHREKLKSVQKNVTDEFNNPSKRAAPANEYNSFFELLFSYANGDISLNDVFNGVLDVVLKKEGEYQSDASARIRSMLYLWSYVLYGVDPNANHCIAIDNVEDFIKVNNKDLIAISLDKVTQLYNILLDFSEEIKNVFAQVNVVHSLHIVMALRRTTWGNLQSRFFGNVNELYNDFFDLTGDITIRDLWTKKARPIWNCYLKNQYDSETAQYIERVEAFFTEPQSKNDMQQRFARLMSHGLRRQGHSLSQVLYQLFFNPRFGIFVNHPDYRGYSVYDQLFQTTREARYLRRCATVGLYLQTQFSRTGISLDHDVGVRWHDLLSGNLSENSFHESRYYGFNGKRRTDGLIINFVKWNYPLLTSESVQNLEARKATFLCMILSTLKEDETPRASKCVAPLYEPLSLYSLVTGILGTEPLRIGNKELYTLAEVILAGAKPDTEAEFSPLYLLQDGIDYEDAQAFSDYLRSVLNGGPIDSADGNHPYCRQAHGIRITEAGADYLHNIQPSFEFFSAFFCNEYPPLPLIRSTEIIAHVIGCVYHYAEKVCNAYAEAMRSPAEGLLFRQRVQEHHTRYLTHYRDYISHQSKTGPEDTASFSEGEKNWLITGIEQVIDYYRRWRVD